MPTLSSEERRHGIVRVGPLDHLRYKCNLCGQVWSPNLRSGGRLPRGWWLCPNGCNT